jgi:hypothetical protein
MVNETTNSQVLSDIYLDFLITKDLTFKSTFAIDVISRKRNYYSGKDLIQYSKTQGGIATIETENQFYWQNENYLNWDKRINANNKLNFMVGLSWQQRSTELVGATAQNFSDDFYQWHNLGAGTVTMPSSSNDVQWAINSYFARLNYNLADKYLFTVTGRYDGSSKFPTGLKWRWFPSFSAGWRASEESFMEWTKPILSSLKLRGSFGVIGDQTVPGSLYIATMGSGQLSWLDPSGTNLRYVGVPSAVATDITWQDIQTLDLGIDLRILNDEVGITFGWYQRDTKNMIVPNESVTTTYGVGAPAGNYGDLLTNGWEISVDFNHRLQN